MIISASVKLSTTFYEGPPDLLTLPLSYRGAQQQTQQTLLYRKTLEFQLAQGVSEKMQIRGVKE